MIGGALGGLAVRIAVAAALVGAVAVQTARLDARTAALDAARRSVAALQRQLEAVEIARDVARAERDRQARRAAEFDAIRDRLRGLQNDGEIDPALLGVLSDLGLRRNAGSGVREPEGGLGSADAGGGAFAPR